MQKFMVWVFKTKSLYTIAFYIVAMVTTIQVSNELLNVLKRRKMIDNESYEEVIWDMLEDTMELSAETKRHIEQAQKEFKEGKYKTLEEVEKELGFS